MTFVSLLSRVRLFATPRTVACWGPLSIGFPDRNPRVGGHFLLRGTFPTQGSNLRLLRWQAGSLPLRHMGSPL